MTTATAEVLLPTSPEEAVEAFGDGSDVTVVGGGTILVPEVTAGRVRPGRVLLLSRAGLDRMTHDGGSWTIGAATTIETLAAERARAAPHCGAANRRRRDPRPGDAGREPLRPREPGSRPGETSRPR